MTHLKPNIAATVAVATPCWPAPVSAMMRVLPIRRASRICPMQLLILWAPVWSRSSRAVEEAKTLSYPVTPNVPVSRPSHATCYPNDLAPTRPQDAGAIQNGPESSIEVAVNDNTNRTMSLFMQFPSLLVYFG